MDVLRNAYPEKQSAHVDPVDHLPSLKSDAVLFILRFHYRHLS